MFAVICQEESVLSLKNSSPEALRVVEGGETLSNIRGNSEIWNKLYLAIHILTTSPPRGTVPYTNLHFLSS